MKKIENDEKKIINEIMNIITKYYPRIERNELLLFNTSELRINISFLKENRRDLTYINFYEFIKTTKISEEITIDGLISPTTVNELIFTILEDYDYFRNVSSSELGIGIDLGLDLKYGRRKGINCNRIGVNLDFYNYPNNEELIETYMNEILKVYRYEINNALNINNELKHKLKMY